MHKAQHAPRLRFMASHPVTPLDGDHTMGHPRFTLSEQIKDTARAHGIDWALWHYVHNPRGPRLSTFEWSILSRPAQCV